MDRESSRWGLYIERSKFLGNLLMGRNEDEYLVNAARSALVAGPLSFSVGVVGFAKIFSGETERGMLLAGLSIVLLSLSSLYGLYQVAKCYERDGRPPFSDF